MLSTRMPSLHRPYFAAFLALVQVALSSVDGSASLYLEMPLSEKHTDCPHTSSVWRNLEGFMLREVSQTQKTNTV